jgi:sec-independent protein translocase protein TatA
MIEGLFRPMHMLIIFGLGVLFFGPKKLPELGKGLGEGILQFKKAFESATSDSHDVTKPDSNKA